MHARKGNGPELHWNGKSFNNDKKIPLHFFSKAATAKREGKKLLAQFPVLRDYKIYVTPITHFEKQKAGSKHLRGGARYRQMRGGSKAPKANPSLAPKQVTHFEAQGRTALCGKKGKHSYRILTTPRDDLTTCQRCRKLRGTFKQNPSARQHAQLDAAAKKLEDFTGHKVGSLESAYSRSSQKTGLIIGELDLVGYRATRDGKTERYGHTFKKHSRPLLAVTSDGKQLHIVGGQYEFTEAGIEDR
jgi:hypothetical protein